MMEKQYINIFDYTMTGSRRTSTPIYCAEVVTVSRIVLIGYNGNDSYTRVGRDMLYVVMDGEAVISIKGDGQYLLVKGDILPVVQGSKFRVESASCYPHCVILEVQHGSSSLCSR